MKFNYKIRAFSLIELSIVIIIIGILIAGVTQGSRFIKKSRLVTAKNLTRGSDVNSIKGLSLWFETSNPSEKSISNSGVKILEDGDSVTSWTDINPNFIHAISISGTASYKRDGVGGLPSISFNGSSHCLGGTYSPIEAGDDTYTLIAVLKVNTASSAYIGGQIPYATTPSNSTLGSIVVMSDSTVRMTGLNNDANSTITSPAGQETIVIIGVDNSSSPNIDFYVNSNTVTTATSGSPSTLNIANSGFVIGCRYTGAATKGSYFNGLVSEFIVFDRKLKASEVKLINSYLSKKYKIKIS